MSTRTNGHKKRAYHNYAAPTMSVYGSVIGMTAAGTNGSPEDGSSSLNKQKP